MKPGDLRHDVAPAARPAVVARASAATRWLSGEDLTALALFVITALLIAGSGWISPGLGSWSQARAILVLSTFVMVVGFGQQTVILIGGLDLSIPAMLTLGATLMFSYVGGAPLALVWGVPLVLLVTGAIGAVSGTFIALLRVPPFIMTLAMGIILSSALLGITGGAPQGVASRPLVRLFTGDWLGAPPVVYLMAGLTALVVVMQRCTAFGRMLYAIGSSPAAAHIAGLPVARVTILCYAISGASAGFAGILMVGFSEGATLNSGDDILIPSVAAVVVGGTSILGGRGTYLGVVGGALLLATFSTMISALGLGAGWRAVIYGSVILLALLTLQEDSRRLWSIRLRSILGAARSANVSKSSNHPGGNS